MVTTETNDDETVEKRRSVSDQMKRLSDEMDVLYPQYEAFVATGTVPTQVSAPDKEDGGEDAAGDGDLDGMSKEELAKMRKSVATKIQRARNMLLYQSETRQDAENPMTDEVKKAKYQAKIEALTPRLKEIEVALAKKV